MKLGLALVFLMAFAGMAGAAELGQPFAMGDAPQWQAPPKESRAERKKREKREVAPEFTLVELAVLSGSIDQPLAPQAPDNMTTSDISPQLIPIPGAIDRIVVDKSDRKMELRHRGWVVRVYHVALGKTPKGDKVKQGDAKTPEGVFKVNSRNDKSQFYLSLGIDYPQARHVAKARKGGYDPGGDIMIHAQPNQLPAGRVMKGDWTLGCIAVTNAEMDEIWAHTGGGTVVEIRP
jgi:murein L,D-transpeptidase YafK